MNRACLVAALLASCAVLWMFFPAGAVGEQASEPASTAAAQLDVGSSFSCAIVTGGQVRCWGYGAEGELGYPGVTTVGVTDTPASVGPRDIGSGFTVTAISSGDYHTCVIRNDGSVVCWGLGADGRLGYGNTDNVGDTRTPGSVGPVNLGVGRTAVAISAGGAHTCAILDNGSVLCWGFGFDGQLGYGNTNNVTDPSAGQPLSVVACASSTECTAVDRSARQATFNPTTPSPPTSTPVDTGNAVTGAVCSLPSQCIVVDRAGQEVTFNPGVPDSQEPATIDKTNVLSGLSCPSANQCTTADNSGQEVTFDPSSPLSPTIAIVDSSTHNLIGVACASASQCTAIDAVGEEVTFNPVTGAVQSKATVDAGNGFGGVACASASQCTVVDGSGQEVTFNAASGAVQTQATVDAGNSLSGVACASASECTSVDGSGREVTFNPASGAVESQATVDGGNNLSAVACPTTSQCTGVDGSGREVTFNPATGITQSQATVDTVGPVYLGPGRTAMAISAGSRDTCAILDNGNVSCWGYGGNGRLGYGNTSQVGDGVTPVEFGPPDLSVAAAGSVDLGAGHRAVAISAGGDHTCAIVNDGSVRCWGFGFDGQLGDGSQSNVGDNPTDAPDTTAPVNLGAGRTAVAITAGSAHTCAILDNGSVLCWGYGAYGRLGYGSTSNVGDTPADIPGIVGAVNLGPGRTALAISAGDRHTCASLDNGTIRCWGYGGNGRLGYCSEGNVGDTLTATPDTAGPVNLVPGDGGELCPAPAPVSASPPTISGQTISGQKLTEGHGSWSPAPTGYSYQWERCDATGTSCGTITGATGQTYTLGVIDVGSTIRVLETASDGGASSTTATSAPTAVVKAAGVPDPDVLRTRGFRACLATVSARAKETRALAHRGSQHQRARARRRLARQLAAGRALCVQRWGRTPGHVTGLRALARGKTRIELDFTAPGTDGRNPPPANSYLVKQSPRPIASSHDFITASALCHGACRFTVSQIGTTIKLTVTALRPDTGYYYSVAALDNVTARPGPRSRMVKAKTA
jgi:alpha-tubulin suppressor-like RCC1 family protein